MVNEVLLKDLCYIDNNFEYKDDLKGKTFFVTGATGLVGSLFVKALAMMNERNHMNMRIIALVRNTKKAEDIFSDFMSEECGLNILAGDVTDDGIVDKVGCELPDVDINYIIHGACITTSKIMVEQPVDTIRTSIYGTENMLELARKYNADKMIYLSSMEMYGTVDSASVTEDKLGYVNLANVRSCYPESKRMCECMCTSYAKQYGVNVCSARLAQTFGPGIFPTENRIFAQFAKSVIRKENIVLHTRGLSEGNYCYTTDVILALLLLMIKGQKGESYNVVNEACHTTIADMAKMVCHNIADDDIEVEFDLPEDIATYGYAPDVKLKLCGDKLKELGFTATVGLEEAYRRLIAYMTQASWS